MKAELAVKEPDFIDQLKTMEQILDFGQKFIDSGMAPPHFKKKEAVMVAIAYGKSIGLNTMAAVQQVVVVNGLPTLKGDAAKALILSSGICTKWEESTSGTFPNDDYTYNISAERKDGQKMTVSFSVFDAKRAGLWISEEKAKLDNGKWAFGPWYKYPKRMVKYRALGFMARDLFPDVLQGMVTVEEAQDFTEYQVVEPVVTDEGQTVHPQPGHKGTLHVSGAIEATKKSQAKKTTPAEAIKIAKSAEELKGLLTKDQLKELCLQKKIPFTATTTSMDLAISLFNFMEDEKKVAADVPQDNGATETPVQKEVKPVVKEVPSTGTKSNKGDVVLPALGEEVEEEFGGDAPPVAEAEAPKQPQGPSLDEVNGERNAAKQKLSALIAELPDSRNGGREMNVISPIWQLMDENFGDDNVTSIIRSMNLKHTDLEEMLNVGTKEEFNKLIAKL